MKRRLPIGIQDFESIREGGFCYVDKTALIHRLISRSDGAFFLLRPRRFGKSLLCSILGAIFEDRRELFDTIAGQPALTIHSLEWEWKKYPVIRLDLNPGNYAEGMNTLKLILQNILENVAISFGINLRSEVRIADGRINTLVETKNYVYCFEFKLNGSAEEALTQIDTKDYLLPWVGSGKNLIKVGVGFDHEKRNIGAWKTNELRIENI